MREQYDGTEGQFDGIEEPHGQLEGALGKAEELYGSLEGQLWEAEDQDGLDGALDEDEELLEEGEEQRRKRWEQRKQEIKRKKRSRVLRLRALKIGVVAALAAAALLFFTGKEKGIQEEPGKEPAAERKMAMEIMMANGREPYAGTGKGEGGIQEQGLSFQYAATEETKRLKDGIASSHAILVDLGSRAILAGRKENKRMVPASMTKVLTLLVAVEQMEDWEGKFKITEEITDYCYINDCSSAGFAKGEKVTVQDLLYGTILPSGGDAALGLAYYVAGSQEAFVELMNKKLEELGLAETAHFTNCIGLYDEDHYCTAYDMAVIMEAALSNELCKEVLSSRTYTTSATKQHPEGIALSNWFLRRIEDKDTGGQVVGGKTGYVAQSGNCAASYWVDEGGREYICVTADAPGSWKCIYDHAYLYKKFSEMD